MKKSLLIACIALLTPIAHADLILVTAIDNGPSTGGVSVTDTQFVANRFSLTEATTLTEVGGLLGVGRTDSIFAAFIALSGPAALPSFDAQSLAANALAFTLISVAGGSGVDDRSSAINVALAAGDYAVVFGSGLFGATSNSFFDRVVTITSDYNLFVGNVAGGNWFNNSSPARIFLSGNLTGDAGSVPEPGTLTLLCLGLVGLRLVKRKTS